MKITYQIFILILVTTFFEVNAQVNIVACNYIRPIHFNFGEFDFKEDEITKLEYAIKLLKDNPTSEMEIHGHTDCRGSKSSNLKLSKKRAQVVIDYFIKNGIDKTRLCGKDYGEKKLINSCNCNEINPCTDEQYLENNRVEFVFVKF